VLYSYTTLIVKRLIQQIGGFMAIINDVANLCRGHNPKAELGMPYALEILIFRPIFEAQAMHFCREVPGNAAPDSE